MNFERGGDIKETLKVGRKANALKLSCFDIKAETAIPVVKGTLTNKLVAKYNFKEGTVALKMGFSFLISEHALIRALEILSQDGICKRFDDYIRDLIRMRIPDEIKKYPDVSFDLTGDILAKVKWVVLRSTDREETIQLTFKTTGRDLLYQNQLYRIAPPKDGGFKEDE